MDTFFNIYFTGQTFPTVLIGTVIFAGGRPRKKYFWPKLLLSGAVFTVISYFMWSASKDPDINQYLRYLLIFLCNIVFFAASAAICWFCFDCSIKNTVFYVVAGWTSQHLVGALSSLLSVAFGVEVTYYDYTWQYFTINLCCYIAVYTAIWFIFLKHHKAGSVINDNSMFVPALTAFLAITLLNMLSYTDDTQSYVAAKCYAVACCILTLFLIYKAYENKALKDEIEVLEELDRKKSEQYQISKESVDLINTRTHDLKKLVNTLSNMGGTISDEELQKLQDEIRDTDAVALTGNDALDTVFTEKGNHSRKNSIELSVIVDADDLSFMTDIELYSIFSNILDNAIEANMNLEKGRMINVRVRETNGFLIIHEDNPYNGTIKKKGDRYLTSKKDKDGHGYGILSIRRTVEKHSGETSITASGNVFNIDIAIPVPVKNTEIPQEETRETSL